MNLIRWMVAFGLLICVAVILYPAYSPYLGGERREAYLRILDFHQANHAPMRLSYVTGQKNKPFLYLSWFSTGDPRHADEFLAYPDGMIFGRRVLWNYAVQGWGSATQLPSSFRQLQSLPPLPLGIARPGDVPYTDLLIVSQNRSNTWRTNYYDRHHLPISVISMLQIAGPLGNVPVPNLNVQR